LLGLVTRLAEAGAFPDRALRFGIRRLLEARIRQSVSGDQALRAAEEEALLASFARGPIALSVDAANEQHYEVPAAFFEEVLGPRLKYSCCLWDGDTTDLGAAEEAMLELTAERAGIEDGMQVLDLGCGWGSFTLWAAERFPKARFLAVSNSALQRALIRQRAATRGLDNVEAQTCDVNVFGPTRRFDRVVSIEMMEHVRNHAELFRRIAGWLEPGGAAFAHIFCHRSRAYAYEAKDESDWMAEHFFTGGMMPSEQLFQRYQDHLELRAQWRVGGEHYARTCNAWLARLDARRDDLMPTLARVYGRDAPLWLQRWRLFFMACAELFAYRGGREWFVAHYRWGLSG